MKKYKYFVKSVESLLDSTEGNESSIEHLGWGNGYIIVPLTHPYANYVQVQNIGGCFEIDYSSPVEEKLHWEEITESDKGMWLWGSIYY